MRWLWWWAIAIVVYFMWLFGVFEGGKAVVVLAFIACMLAFEAAERR